VKVLDVLSNDGGVGALRVTQVIFAPGSTPKGTVQPLNQQGVLYTATYRGVPFTELLIYHVQDQAGNTGYGQVKVDVGE
jgi:hypothetical protein